MYRRIRYISFTTGRNIRSYFLVRMQYELRHPGLPGMVFDCSSLKIHPIQNMPLLYLLL